MTPRQRLARALAESIEAAKVAGAIKLKLYREAKDAGVAEERHIARAEALARSLASLPPERGPDDDRQDALDAAQRDYEATRA